MGTMILKPGQNLDESALASYAEPLADIAANISEPTEIQIECDDDMQADGFRSTTHGVIAVYVPSMGRAAVNAYQGGDWQWTDAASMADAIRRYREGDLSA